MSGDVMAVPGALFSGPRSTGLPASSPWVVAEYNDEPSVERTDVRPALDSIQAPTLLLHRHGDRHVNGGHARYLAERIPKARLVEFDGDDNVWFAGDSDRVLDEIESFVTGVTRRHADEPRAVDRVVHRHRRIDRTRRGARR